MVEAVCEGDDADGLVVAVDNKRAVVPCLVQQSHHGPERRLLGAGARRLRGERDWLAVNRS